MNSWLVATTAMFCFPGMGEYSAMAYDLCHDFEWELASSADEDEYWYWCQMANGGYTYHRYKPSVARLLTKRDGLERVMEQYASLKRSE